MAHILVVEDNAMNLRLVRDILEYRGHRISTATNGTQCREALTAPAPLPDLVLMDIRLGNESGEELLREIRADQRTAAMRVLALTAQAMQGDEERLMEAGFDGYLAKPVDTRTLGPTVEAYLPRPEE